MRKSQHKKLLTGYGLLFLLILPIFSYFTVNAYPKKNAVSYGKNAVLYSITGSTTVVSGNTYSYTLNSGTTITGTITWSADNGSVSIGGGTMANVTWSTAPTLPEEVASIARVHGPSAISSDIPFEKGANTTGVVRAYINGTQVAMLSVNISEPSTGGGTDPGTGGGTPTGSLDLSRPVGTPDGGGSVSPSGSASYTVPIKLLPGLNGIQPDVSLVYSNQGGDGIAGFGWNLSCLSMITRTGNGYYYNGKTTGVNYKNANDVFVLDGQRLFTITGSNGANGTVYGTENEQYSKIESFGGSESAGPDWFRVTLKNGTLMEYGHATNSIMKTDNLSSNMIWFLNKVTDRNGNFESFTYGLNQADRTYQLATIEYSGNEAQGLSPNITVQFLYTIRQYWETAAKYHGGAKLKDAFNLSTINIKKEGTTVRSYSFAYSLNRQLYFLQSITEKGSDGTALNPLVFTYGSNTTAADVSVPGVRYDNMHGGNIYAGDFNGDSRQDVLSVNYSIDNYGIRHDSSYDVLSDFGSYAGSPSVSFFYNYSITNSTGSNVRSVNGGGKRGPQPGTQFGYMTMDYDGDGKEDVLMVKSTTLTSGDVKFTGVDINYSRYYSVYTGASYKTESYNSIPHITQYVNDFVYTYRNGSTYGNNFVSGDFDGDGCLDYILILGTGPTGEFRGFFNSPKKGIVNKEILNFHAGDGTARSIANANQLLAMDFDGDGKQELFVMIDTKTYILSIYPVSASTGYEYASEIKGQTPAFYGDFPVYVGDFNGDGKMDVFYRNSKNSSFGSWYIMTSTGNPESPYVSTSFVWANRHYLPQDNGGSAHHLVLGDFNGDGKTDIWQSLDQSSTQSRHNLYYSNGSSFITESYYVSQGNLNGSTSANTVVGDFNGDGKPDILGVNSSSKGAFIYPKPFKEELFLTKAVDGLGVQENFNYDRINSGSGVYERSWYYEYDDPDNSSISSLRNGNPYNVFYIPMYVVGQKTKSNGIGTNGLGSLSYHYKDAVFRKTRGFLGFQAFQQAESATGVVSATEQAFSHSVLLLHPTHSYSLLGNDTILDTKITDTLQLVNPSNYFDKRYVHKILKTVSYNGATGAASETANTYDGYGNITVSVEKKGYMSGTSVSAVETGTTTTVFGAHGNPYPSLPDNITVKNTRTGQSEVTKTTALTYDSKGNILTKTSFSGRPKAVTTTNTYDGYGNLAQSVVSASGVSSRTTKYTYDNTGRYLLQKEQVGTGISKKTVLTYDNTFGNIASVKSPEGLTTSYTYDVFARRKKTSLPEGYDITETLSWESTTGRYSLATIRPGGGSNTKTYYDLLGREVRAEVSGFNDATLVSTKTYDNRGLVTSQVSPHYSSETAVTTTNTYDNMSRLTQTSNGTVTTGYAYTKLGNGQFKTTVTDGAGQSSSKTEDATGKVVNASDNGGSLNYTYNSRGNQTQTSLNGSVAVSSMYDEYGNQTSLTDRNAGTVTYEYDAFGQLTKQTDALNHVTTMAYDLFGRVVTRVGTEGTTTYEYWKDATSGYCSDNPTKVTGFGGEVKEYSYDNLRRMTQEKVTVDNTAFPTQYVYDTYGNLTQTTYPSSVVINRVYDHNGIETQVKMGSTVLFTATAMNSMGKYTAFSTGNGKSSTESYNLATGTPTQFLTSGVQNLTFSFNAQTGNLTQRKDVLKNLQEDFTYDNLNRLLTVKVNNVQTQALTYDGNSGSSLGNIATKTDAGTYTYNSSKVNAVAYITNPAGATTPPTTIPTTQQDITYTAFLKTLKVTDNNYELEYTYGSDYQRIKGVLKHSGSLVEAKYYLGDMERQQSFTTGALRDIHYISAGNGLCAIIVKEGGATNVFYAYKDYLGSIVTVTNNTGVVVAEQSFDAWGRKRNPNDWTYNNLPTTNPSWLYRGYTGHEHLDEFTLINMNGRMYDPVQGRMMSPDNYVPTPWNTQGYNRFGYALNNPFSYVDPDGNFIHIIVGAFLGGVINLAIHTVTGKINNVGDAFAAFGIGAAAGAITAATGGAAAVLTSTGSLTGALSYSAVSAASGVISGAAAGFVGSATGGAVLGIGNAIYFHDEYTFKDWRNGVLWGTATGAIMGGISAKAQGKNIWTGKTNTKGNIIVGDLTPADGQKVDKAAQYTDVTASGQHNIALGVNENLDDFAKSVNGSTWKTWGTSDFQSQFLEKINNPTNNIHFNLDGISNPWSAISEGAKGFFNSRVTSWELYQIYSNPSALQRTVFYLGGKVVPNPFY